GRDPVVARRSTVAQRLDRGVGGGDLLRARLVGLVGPVRRDVGDVPRTTREDPGLPVHVIELRVQGVRRRKHWGWGFADEQPSADELRAAAAGLAEHVGFGGEVEEPVPLEAVRLAGPRVAVPDGLCRVCADGFHRARFGLGCSYADVVHGMRGRVAHPPDAVLFPRDEREVEAALEWAAGANVAVIPVGGGTSVVGGIEPRVPERFDGAVSLSLSAFDALHDLDAVSGAAQLGAGLPGPAAEAVRAIVQSGLRPSNVRLIEAGEARFTMAGDGSAHLLVLGFESPSVPVEGDLERALAFCGAGEVDPPKAQSSGAWRSAFLRAPYVRDTFVAMGVLSETFETAITWERFGALREAAVGAARRVLDDERATVTCRFTHAYPDGPAPYFTVLAPARRGEEADQWWAVKRAASDAVIDAGGTITHHHAVGRDHPPPYQR